MAAKPGWWTILLAGIGGLGAFNIVRTITKTVSKQPTPPEGRELQAAVPAEPPKPPAAEKGTS